MRPRPSLVLALCVLAVACQSSASTSPSASETGSSQPTPLATTVAGYPTLVADLGPDAAPIDVVVAFGSVWVANHHSDDVVRIDPATGAEEARIPFTDGTGPAWFAVADDGVWITRQNTMGIAHIDPETNELDPNQAGNLPPCGPPTVGLGAVWYLACDTGQMVRIDLESFYMTMVAAPDLSNPIAIDDHLYAVGLEGVVRLGDDGETWEPVAAIDGPGRSIGFAGGTLWVAIQGAVQRIDLATGQVVASIPMNSPGVMSAGSEEVWLTHEAPGPLEHIRIADNTVLEPLETSESPVAVWTDGSTVWMTDFNTSDLWRIDTGG
jgi:YVTN family beta-propeller protein